MPTTKNFTRPIPTPAATYQQIAKQMAYKYSIPVNIFLKHIEAESNWDPKVTSPKGAVGLGQLMPETIKLLGVKDPLNPTQNLEASARHLRALYQRFGDWKLAVAAYNAGGGAVTKYNGIPPFPETQSHVNKVFATNPGFTRPLPGPPTTPQTQQQVSELIRRGPSPLTASTSEIGPTEQIYSGGTIQDVFDFVSTPFFYGAGFLQDLLRQRKQETGEELTTAQRLAPQRLPEVLKQAHEAGIQGIQHRTEWIRWLEKEYPWTRQKVKVKEAGTATNPYTGEEMKVSAIEVPYSIALGTILNLVLDPTYMVGKGLRVGFGAAKSAIPRLSEFMGFSLTPGFITRILNHPDRIILKKYEQVYDQLLRDRSTLIESAGDTFDEVRSMNEPIRETIFRASQARTVGAMRSILSTVKKLGQDPVVLEKTAVRLRTLDNELAQELTQLGLISEEVAKANKGNMLNWLFKRGDITHRYINMLAKVDPIEAERLANVLTKHGAFPAYKLVKGIPKELVKAARTERAALPLAQQAVLGAETAIEAVAKNKFFKNLADTFGEVYEATGTRQVPNTQRWGELKGLFVPEAVWQHLNEWDTIQSKGMRTWRWIHGQWKAGKTVWNPALHARNMLGNLLLADLGAGLSPARIDIYAKAVDEILSNGPMWKELKANSTIAVDTFARIELGQRNAMLRGFQAPGSLMEKFGRIFQIGKSLPGQAYQFEEQTGKMAVYIFKRRQGLAPVQAAAEAEKWLFNYRKVPRWVDNLRSGRLGPISVPFITFTYKALPTMAEAIIKNPQRVSRWYKYSRAIEMIDETDEEKRRKLLPDWMQTGYWVKLPVKKGNEELWIDLSFYIPFQGIGNIWGGEREVPIPLINKRLPLPNLSFPFLTFVEDLARNQNRFTGQKVWDEGDPPPIVQQKVTEYIMDFALPPLAPGARNWRKIYQAVNQIPDRMGRVDTMTRVLAETIAGIKTKYIDADQQFTNRLTQMDKDLTNIKSRLSYYLADPGIDDKSKDELVESSMRLIEEKILELEDLMEAAP